MRFNHPAAATAFRAVARIFGEVVRIEPLVASEYAVAVADNDRPAVAVRATVALSPTVDGLEGARRGGEFQGMTRLAQREARIWITPNDYAAIGYDLRVSDRVILVDRAGAPSYRISRRPEISDRGDVMVHLVAEADQ